MRTTQRILILLFAAQMAFAQPCPPKDMDALFERARALLRSYNCRKSKSLADCEMQMGLGPAMTLGAAGVLGAAMVGSVRNPNFGVCALASLNPWIETAYAAGCTPGEKVMQARLASINDRALADANAKIAQQQLIIDNSKKALAEPERASAPTVDQARVDDLKRKRDLKSQELDAAYRRATGRTFVSPEQIKNLRNQGVPEAVAKQLEDLQAETARLWKALESAKVGTTPQAAIRGLSSQERATLTKDLQAMEANLKDLQKFQEDLKSVQKALESVAAPTKEQLAEIARSLSQLVASEPQHALLAEHLKKDISEIKPLAIRGSISDVNGDRKVAEALKSARPGGLKKAAGKVVGTAVANIGLITASQAAAFADVGDVVDPVSWISAHNKAECQGMPEKDNKLLIPRFENKCDPFVLNEQSAKYLNGNKEELQALICQYPEVEEFINRNYKTYYTGIQGRCENNGSVVVNLPEGSRYIMGRGQVTYYEQKITPRPTIINLDQEGRETSIEYPRPGGYGKAATEEIKLSTKPPEVAAEYLSGLYQSRLPILAEVKACCSTTGLKPTSAECSRYGISSAAGSKGADSGFR